MLTLTIVLELHFNDLTQLLRMLWLVQNSNNGSVMCFVFTAVKACFFWIFWRLTVFVEWEGGNDALINLRQKFHNTSKEFECGECSYL